MINLGAAAVGSFKGSDLDRAARVQPPKAGFGTFPQPHLGRDRATGRLDKMSHRKWRESKQQLI